MPEPIDLGGLLSAVQPALVTSNAPLPRTNSLANLFNALLKAGVVSASGTPTGAGAPAKVEESTTLSDPVENAARQYRKAVLKHKIKLTSADITKYGVSSSMADVERNFL